MSDIEQVDEETIKDLTKKWEKAARETTLAHMKEIRAYGNLSRAMTQTGQILHPVIKRAAKRKESEPEGVAVAAAPAAAQAAAEPPKKKGKAATKKVATKAAAEKK